MSNLSFTETGWKDYVDWINTDKKVIKKINRLLEDIGRNGNEGIGKPEPLKNELSGLWSRRIDDVNRLVYMMKTEGEIVIYQCKGHYDN